MRNACVVLVSLICFAALPIQAEDKLEDIWQSGNGFFRMCHATDKATEEMTNTEIFHGNLCLSYLAGIEDGIWLQADSARSPGHGEPLPYCINPNVQRIQPVRILLKYIRDNPAKAHLRTVELFGFAMKEAFPCPTSPAPR
jgi:hypothetical protein